MTKQEIILFLKKNKTLISKQFQVNEIGLFGSYANGTQKTESDIDLIVSMPSNLDLFFALKSFLQTNLGKEIDLALEKSMRLFIKEAIKDEVIYV